MEGAVLYNVKDIHHHGNSTISRILYIQRGICLGMEERGEFVVGQREVRGEGSTIADPLSTEAQWLGDGRLKKA